MKARNRKEIASLYGFGCVRTLTRRLKKYDLQIEKRILITPKKQIEIFAALGIPLNLTEEEHLLVRKQMKKLSISSSKED